MQAKSVEQQSVMVDGLRLLIAGRLDWNAAVATATPLLPAQNSAAPLDENAQHIHAFCALEHYWNTHMHLVEDAFNGVNARHRYGARQVGRLLFDNPRLCATS